MKRKGMGESIGVSSSNKNELGDCLGCVTPIENPQQKGRLEEREEDAIRKVLKPCRK